MKMVDETWNIDDIVEDWFSRLPNGYAKEPYSVEELSVLREVLEDMGVVEDASDVIRKVKESQERDFDAGLDE